MRRWLVALMAVLVTPAVVLGGVPAPRAAAVDTPIGTLGQVLRVQFQGLVADVAVSDIVPTDPPPGFGYPPRAPRYQVFRATVTITPVRLPTPYAMGITFQFRGVTPTGDAYEPRNSDAPDALQYQMQAAQVGRTFTGGVWWDCYRDLVSNVALQDKITGQRLAQWNVS
jgi:hypothetical protein